MIHIFKKSVEYQHSLKSNVLWNIVGYASNAIFQWSIITVFAKTNHIEMIGHYSLALSVSTPIAMFCWLSLRSILSSDTSNQFNLNIYVNLRIVMGVLGFFMTIISVVILHYDYMQSGLVLILAMTKVFDGISDMYLGYYQQKGRSYILGQSLFIKSILSLSLFSTIIILTSSIWLATLSTTGVSILMLFIFDTKYINIKEKFSVKVEHKDLIKLFLIALPLGIVPFIYNLFIAVPRFFIEKNLGIKSVGFYASIYFTVMAGVIITIALTDTIVPIMSKHRVEYQRTKLEKLLAISIFGSLILVGIGLVFAKYFGSLFLAYIFNSEFAQYNQLLMLGIIMLGTEVVVKLLSNTLTVFRKLKIQTVISIFGLICIIVSCFFLIPIWGLNAAFISQIIANIAQIIVIVLILKKAMNQWFKEHSIS